MEIQLNTADKEGLKTCLKVHKGKTKFMTNIDTIDNIQIDGTETDMVINYKYHVQTIPTENRTKQVSIRIQTG